MDIRWTVIVLGALLHGTQSNQDTQESLLSGIISSTQKTSSSGEPIPTTKSKTEPSATTVLTTATNQLTGPASQTPLANRASQTSPTAPISQTSPIAPTSQTSPIAPNPQTSPIAPNSQTSPTTQNVQTISTASTMQTNSAASTTQPISTASTAQTKSADSTLQTSSAETSMQTKTTESAPSGTAGVSPTSTQNIPVKPTPTSQIQSATNVQDQPTATVSTTSENTGPNKGTHSQTTATNILHLQPFNPTEQDSTSTLSTSSTAFHSHQKTDAQTSTITIKSDHSTSPPKTEDRTPKNISVKFDLSESSKEDVTFKACKTLGLEMKGTCSVNINIVGKQLFARVTIDADQIIPKELYEPLEQENITKETIPDTLIAILGSCGALVLILCFFAAYCAYHRRSYRKNQQHLTEELHTVENGYHDNPTLEVMEVQPEMQEKKLALNGEFNDSWIVPIDNLLKEDIPDEEDTHL